MTDEKDAREHVLRAVSALDDALRAMDARPSWRVDTLSTSLSDPHGYSIAATIEKAVAAVQNDADRDSLASVVRVVHAAGLIDAPATARLLGSLGR